MSQKRPIHSNPTADGASSNLTPPRPLPLPFGCGRSLRGVYRLQASATRATRWWGGVPVRVCPGPRPLGLLYAESERKKGFCGDPALVLVGLDEGPVAGGLEAGDDGAAGECEAGGDANEEELDMDDSCRQECWTSIKVERGETCGLTTQQTLCRTWIFLRERGFEHRGCRTHTSRLNPKEANHGE